MNENKIPRHVAIVMDGNGRWARQRGMPRVAGHTAGRRTVQLITEACAKRGVEVLSLFAFGRENWGRPADEVNGLMRLFVQSLERETKKLHKENVQFRVMGDVSRLDPALIARIKKAEELTRHNTGLKLVIVVDYSGRWDIVQAVRKLAQEVASGKLSPESIDESHLQPYLCWHDLPEPDLFIRTSGELRISNFMLWQLAYTELYFTPTLWPDFNEVEFEKALNSYAERERRFGLVAKEA